MPLRKRATRGRRLLSLACSARKIAKGGALPAIYPYDGVAFRVVKRLMRLHMFPDNVDVMIISSTYGLMSHRNPIRNYDLRMTSELALKSAPRNCDVLKKAVA